MADVIPPHAVSDSGSDPGPGTYSAADIGAANTDTIIQIHGLSSSGAGVGRLADGRVVFVPRTAPGDGVRVRVTAGKRRWAKGGLREVVVPSPHRVSPSCPHYRSCGGCTLQHVAYPQQLHWKREIVREALRRISHVEISLPEVIASPAQSAYRSRVTFTLLRLAAGRVIAGFHQLDAPRRIVDVEGGCILPEPEIAAVWTGLRAAWGDGARRLPSGPELRLTLRAVDEGVILVVAGGRGPGRPDILLREVEGLVAVWSETPDGRGKLLAGSTKVLDTRNGEVVPTGPMTFLQVNRAASEALHEWVLEQAHTGAGQRVVDAYCGVAQHGRAMARQDAVVLGIELDPAAVKAAAYAAPDGFTVLAGSVEDRIAEALPAHLVILNPPRTGVADKVTDTLRSDGPPRLIYVSCDPATLARDVGRLMPSYEVETVRAFDLFPQTSHVEVVVVLRRLSLPEEGESHTAKTG